jgi:hypothetical protein
MMELQERAFILEVGVAKNINSVDINTVVVSPDA